MSLWFDSCGDAASAASQGFRPQEEKGEQQKKGTQSNVEMNPDDMQGKDQGGEDDMDVNEEHDEDDEGAATEKQPPPTTDGDDDETPYCVDLWLIAKSMDHHQKVLGEIFRANGQASWAVIATRTAHPSILLAAQQVCSEARSALPALALV